MPVRTIPLITNEYYHVFNRGINKQPIFLGIRDYKHSIELLKYYSFAAPKIRFSKFLLFAQDERIRILEQLRKGNKKLVEFTCFCIMPNHFHFLMRQIKDNGISKFMSNFQNSYTRYFNTKYKKFGPILQGQFKAVRIEDDEQLLHVNRYIHLNPYSSFIVKELSILGDYPWSSLPEYLGKVKDAICEKEIVLSNFTTLQNNYEAFVFDHADYQRKLEKIKHLVLEDLE